MSLSTRNLAGERLVSFPVDGDSVNRVFCDAGVIGKNPSKDGGTWAFVGVFASGDFDNVIFQQSGVVLPTDIEMDTVENNICETIAILLALEAMPDGWFGTVYSDNLNAIRRARAPREMKKIVPQFVKDRMIAATARVKVIEYVLLGGHPNKDELKSGYRSDGKPVSRWNVLADDLCCKEAAKFKLASSTIKTPEPVASGDRSDLATQPSPAMAAIQDQRVRDRGLMPIRIKADKFDEGFKHYLNGSTCVVRKFADSDVVRRDPDGAFVVAWPPPSANAGVILFDGSRAEDL